MNVIERSESKRFALNDVRLGFHWIEAAVQDGSISDEQAMDAALSLLQDGCADSSTSLWPVEFVTAGREFERHMIETNLVRGN